MKHQSISQYVEKRVKVVCANGYWYRARILSVTEDAVQLIEERGRTVTINPEAIVMIEELK